MTTNVTSKRVHVLCDHDALYRAIELKLNSLPHVHVIRLDPQSSARPDAGQATGQSDLIIVAPAPPLNDPIWILSRASLLSQVGRVPVLIVSEQPSQPESIDKITYLNFPFDIDDLNDTVAGILEMRPGSDSEGVC